ncbi:MAG: ATP-binding protein [Spirochaetes bacterium]|nr:ATP-binding protein [Spirochaetota bacterium]
MKFYDREKELDFLKKQYVQTDSSSTMTVITGRRRIGKTSLSLNYAKDKKYIYLFVSKKSEILLCEEFIETIKINFNIPIIGEIKDFRTVFNLIMEIGKKEKIVVIIDEFQEFYNINPSVYSDIQNIWDQNKDKTKIHLIFIGSIYSLMIKIFKNSKEPLFGRADRIMYIKPFHPKVLKKILQDNGKYTKENLFINYLITGGVPRYQEILLKNNVFTETEIIDYYFDENSSFIDEGKTILIEEFGKEYGTYFSILELLSEGRTSRSEIESILEKNIGGYLEKLESDYDIISKRKPIGSKTTGRVQKYFIKDNFLSFWFRFVYKYRTAIETGNFKYLKKLIATHLRTYSGPFLEKLYHEILKETNEYNEIGNYWERGNKNEIDIVAINEIEKKILIGEIKLNKDKINMNALKMKSEKLVNKYKNFTIEYVCLGMQDLEKYI